MEACTLALGQEVMVIEVCVFLFSKNDYLSSSLRSSEKKVYL